MLTFCNEEKSNTFGVFPEVVTKGRHSFLLFYCRRGKIRQIRLM